MLTLKLFPGKSIRIDGPCEISLPPGESAVRLCFDASREVQIVRSDAKHKGPASSYKEVDGLIEAIKRRVDP